MIRTDRWLTLDELAEYLKLSRSKLYRMTQDSEIPASKVASQWRFDRHEIDEWMKKQRPSTNNNSNCNNRIDVKVMKNGGT
ncbi:hypothetical protein MNBD_GAMMA22-1898 [hydrothermal vent metagenome]|uniref:Helix-turn-helix domain-containing protein n=1 Tax=hydrothermal vent metagenome TaxID=652676 RepID=A0A3B1APP0_9ZZZZ